MDRFVEGVTELWGFQVDGSSFNEIFRAPTGENIGARVALLWQYNANPSYKLASIPRYDDIVRTAGWAGSTRVADRRPAGDGGPQNRAPHTGSGRGLPASDRPPTGAFSTLLRQSGMRASTGGVLATKSERKMLASTCLYSLYAWLKC